MPSGQHWNGSSGRGTLLEGIFELVPFVEKEMLLLPSLVRPGYVCLDIGASGGVYTLLLSRLAGPTGRVHGFEPRRRSYRLLDAFRRRLRLENVSLHPVALGDRSGVATMLVPRWGHLSVGVRAYLKGGLSGDRHYREFTGSREIEVPVTTLDRFVGASSIPRLDFVKCDVEGAEPAIFEGASETLARHRPVVLCEIEDRHLRKYGRRPEEITAMFERLGYRQHAYSGGRLVPMEVVPDENNYVFLPDDHPVRRSIS